MPEYILAVKDRKPGEPDPAVLDGNIVGEIVRCKDCKNVECEGVEGFLVCELSGFSHHPEFFCADGERS